MKPCLFCKRLLPQYSYNIHEKYQKKVIPIVDIKRLFFRLKKELLDERYICHDCLYVVRVIGSFKKMLHNSLCSDDIQQSKYLVLEGFEIFKSQIASYSYNNIFSQSPPVSEDEHIVRPAITADDESSEDEFLQRMYAVDYQPEIERGPTPASIEIAAINKGRGRGRKRVTKSSQSIHSFTYERRIQSRTSKSVSIEYKRTLKLRLQRSQSQHLPDVNTTMENDERKKKNIYQENHSSTFYCHINCCLQRYKNFDEIQAHVLFDHKLEQPLILKDYTAKVEEYWKSKNRFKDEPVEEYKYPCLINTCNQFYKEFDHLNEHKIKDHNQLAVFHCPECNVRMTSEEDFQNHNKLKHKKNLTNCILCSLTLENILDLQEHLRSHQNRSHICFHCGEKFTDNTKLEEHKKVHQQRKTILNHYDSEKHPGIPRQNIPTTPVQNKSIVNIRLQKGITNNPELIFPPNLFLPSNIFILDFQRRTYNVNENLSNVIPKRLKVQLDNTIVEEWYKRLKQSQEISTGESLKSQESQIVTEEESANLNSNEVSNIIADESQKQDEASTTLVNEVKSSDVSVEIHGNNLIDSSNPKILTPNTTNEIIENANEHQLKEKENSEIQIESLLNLNISAKETLENVENQAVVDDLKQNKITEPKVSKNTEKAQCTEDGAKNETLENIESQAKQVVNVLEQNKTTEVIKPTKVSKNTEKVQCTEDGAKNKTLENIESQAKQVVDVLKQNKTTDVIELTKVSKNTEKAECAKDDTKKENAEQDTDMVLNKTKLTYSRKNKLKRDASEAIAEKGDPENNLEDVNVKKVKPDVLMIKTKAAKKCFETIQVVPTEMKKTDLNFDIKESAVTIEENSSFIQSKDKRDSIETIIKAVEGGKSKIDINKPIPKNISSEDKQKLFETFIYSCPVNKTETPTSSSLTSKPKEYSSFLSNDRKKIDICGDIKSDSSTNIFKLNPPTPEDKNQNINIAKTVPLSEDSIVNKETVGNKVPDENTLSKVVTMKISDESLPKVTIKDTVIGTTTKDPNSSSDQQELKEDNKCPTDKTLDKDNNTSSSHKTVDLKKVGANKTSAKHIGHVDTEVTTGIKIENVAKDVTKATEIKTVDPSLTTVAEKKKTGEIDTINESSAVTTLSDKKVIGTTITMDKDTKNVTTKNITKYRNETEEKIITNIHKKLPPDINRIVMKKSAEQNIDKTEMKTTGSNLNKSSITLDSTSNTAKNEEKTNKIFAKDDNNKKAPRDIKECDSEQACPNTSISSMGESSIESSDKIKDKTIDNILSQKLDHIDTGKNTEKDDISKKIVDTVIKPCEVKIIPIEVDKGAVNFYTEKSVRKLNVKSNKTTTKQNKKADITGNDKSNTFETTSKIISSGTKKNKTKVKSNLSSDIKVDVKVALNDIAKVCEGKNLAADIINVASQKTSATKTVSKVDGSKTTAKGNKLTMNKTITTSAKTATKVTNKVQTNETAAKDINDVTVKTALKENTKVATSKTPTKDNINISTVKTALKKNTEITTDIKSKDISIASTIKASEKTVVPTNKSTSKDISKVGAGESSAKQSKTKTGSNITKTTTEGFKIELFDESVSTDLDSSINKSTEGNSNLTSNVTEKSHDSFANTNLSCNTGKITDKRELSVILIDNTRLMSKSDLSFFNDSSKKEKQKILNSSKDNQFDNSKPLFEDSDEVDVIESWRSSRKMSIDKKSLTIIDDDNSAVVTDKINKKRKLLKNPTDTEKRKSIVDPTSTNLNNMSVEIKNLASLGTTIEKVSNPIMDEKTIPFSSANTSSSNENTRDIKTPKPSSFLIATSSNTEPENKNLSIISSTPKSKTKSMKDMCTNSVINIKGSPNRKIKKLESIFNKASTSDKLVNIRSKTILKKEKQLKVRAKRLLRNHMIEDKKLMKVSNEEKQVSEFSEVSLIDTIQTTSTKTNKEDLIPKQLNLKTKITPKSNTKKNKVIEEIPIEPKIEPPEDVPEAEVEIDVVSTTEIIPFPQPLTKRKRGRPKKKVKPEPMKSDVNEIDNAKNQNELPIEDNSELEDLSTHFPKTKRRRLGTSVYIKPKAVGKKKSKVFEVDGTLYTESAFENLRTRRKNN